MDLPLRLDNVAYPTNAMAPSAVPSPPSIYTMDSRVDSDFTIQDYFPTPEAVRPSVRERNPSSMIIADEETTSPLSLGEDEPTDNPFTAASETQASVPMSGPPRPPDTSTGSGTRMGGGKRYDEAPTPGIFGLRRRASSFDSQTLSGTDGRKRNIRPSGTPRFDSYSGVAGELFGDYRIGRPVEEVDYFSFKPTANSGGGANPHIFEAISPTSVPILIPEAAHTRDAAQPWNNGHMARKDRADDNAVRVVRDSLNASCATLVPPVDDSKNTAAPKKSFGSFSLFRRKKDIAEDDTPGHSRQKYREKVKSMRNGEKLRPSYKRLTTGKSTLLCTPHL